MRGGSAGGSRSVGGVRSVGSGFRGGSVGGGFRSGGFRGNTFVRSRGFGNRFYGGYGFYGGVGFGYGYPYYYPYSYYPYSYDPYYYDSYYSAPYYDSGYYANAYYGNAYPDNVGYVAQPSPPPTVINQNIGGAPAGTSAGTSGSFYRAADYYLIAFNDHTIRAALSYTVDGDQIRYTTREHEEKTAPLSSVDVRFSEQVNRDRRVEFRLP